VAAPPDERLGYRPALDGLRAVAIGLVVLHHTGAFLVPTHADDLFPGGFLGVDVFFVLSGFLITTLLLERRGRERRPIVTFYERRALRLLPAVVVLLIVVSIVMVATDTQVSRIPTTFLVVLSYTTNWAELWGVDISKYVTHLWSLAIEEQFYLVWPLLLYAGLRVVPSLSRLAWAALALGLVFALWRAVLWESGEEWLRIYIRTDARADALLIGAALALAPWRRLIGAVPSGALAAAGAAALIVVALIAELTEPSAKWLYLGGLTVVAALVAVAIMALLAGSSPLTAVLEWTPVVWLGRISYGLYLWHFPVFLYVGEHGASWSSAARVVVGWSVALGATVASYRLIEQPALRFKRRLGTRVPENVQAAP
jgi:peptidoglycan/LPS O-acetylase OafA/YrhL